jgi:Cysteine-rich secretory protein family
MRSGFIVAVLIVLNFLGSQVQAEPDYTMEARAAFQYLNRIRIEAGMIPFTWSDVLEKSAANHAAYLERNKIISHLEKPGQTGFSGVTPGERAISQGYDLNKVTENYSSGRKDSLESIDGLMSAIYHRFGFLDFTKNEVGIALSKTGETCNFVYNMGNDLLNNYCRYAIDTRESPFYQGICSRSERVSADRVDMIENKTAEKNPSYVLWPVDQSENIPTVFYEEIPDPLPGRSVSGYPISFQLNPVFYSRARLISFKLYELSEEGEKEIKSVHLLNKRSDPNRKFTPFQFALFPLNRLKWGTKYRVSIDLLADGEKLTNDWEFTTRLMRYPLFVIAASGDSLDVKGNSVYAVHLPPADQAPFIKKLQMESPFKVQVEVSWEDRNTILLKLSGKSCQPVHFYLDGSRYFSMRLNRTDNINPDHHYPTEFAAKCY